MRNGPILVYVETQLWELNLFLVEQSLSTEMQDSVVGTRLPGSDVNTSKLLCLSFPIHRKELIIKVPIS